MQTTVPVDITKMEATIPEGIDLLVNGRKVNSGPLEVRLDHEARSDGDNYGELDYERNVARARFNLIIDIAGVAKVLARAMLQPIRAVVHSEGVMTEDHNFGLAGPMEIQPHPLFEAGDFSASVLPGR